MYFIEHTIASNDKVNWWCNNHNLKYFAQNNLHQLSFLQLYITYQIDITSSTVLRLRSLENYKFVLHWLQGPQQTVNQRLLLSNKIQDSLTNATVFSTLDIQSECRQLPGHRGSTQNSALSWTLNGFLPVLLHAIWSIRRTNILPTIDKSVLLGLPFASTYVPRWHPDLLTKYGISRIKHVKLLCLRRLEFTLQGRKYCIGVP